MLYDLVGESVECSTADACVTHDEALDRAVRTGQIHDLRARSKRWGREKTGGTAARLRTRSRVGALARPLRRARNRSPGSDDPRLRRWSHGDQPRHGPDCDSSPRCRDEPPVGSTRIHVWSLRGRGEKTQTTKVRLRRHSRAGGMAPICPLKRNQPSAAALLACADEARGPSLAPPGTRAQRASSSPTRR